MSFWTKSTGETSATTVDTSADGQETGKRVDIPNNTKALSVVKGIELAPVREGDEAAALDGATIGYRISWEVIEKGPYQGCTTNQTLKVFASKAKDRDQALDLLFFMDNLFTGGKFAQSGEEPDIAELEAAFKDKPQIALIRGMSSKNPESGEEMYFNWVGGVYRHKEAAPAHKTVNDAVSSALNQVKQQQQAATETKAQAAARLAAEAAAAAAAEEAEAAASAGQGEGMVASDDEIPY